MGRVSVAEKQEIVGFDRIAIGQNKCCRCRMGGDRGATINEYSGIYRPIPTFRGLIQYFL
jgi:hypothetical protein